MISTSIAQRSLSFLTAGKQQRSETAEQSVRNNLDESGSFNDVTHQELLEISQTLLKLPPQQRNTIVARLSHADLTKWNDEIASCGVLGTGGLSADERNDLFETLTSGLETKQQARYFNTIGDHNIRSEFLAASLKHRNFETISTAVDQRLNDTLSIQLRASLEKASAQLTKIQQARTMAQLADDVYSDYSASSSILSPAIRRLNPSQLPADLGITKDQLINSRAGFYAAIYRIDEGKGTKYVVAFRGTEDWTDWKTNGASIARITTQFDMAEKLVKNIVHEKGIDAVTVTGHSLGGGLANYTALNHNVVSMTFNAKGSTLPEILSTRDFLGSKANRLITNYQVQGEILTGLQENLRIMFEAPGNKHKLPPIKPDGKTGNMLKEAIEEIVLNQIPIIGPGLAGKHNISGPIDRHSMDYVKRGIQEVTEVAKTNALHDLFESYRTGQ